MARFKKEQLSKKKVLIISASIMAVVVAIVAAFFFFNRNDINIPKLYEYDDLTEYIDLGEYKNLEYTKQTASVSSGEIEDYIMGELESSAKTESVKSGTVDSTSQVVINYVGKIDGKEFNGGSGEGIDVDMTKNNFINGFQEGLLGHDVGETIEVNVTFPDDYAETSIAGKAATFTIEIVSLKVTQTPEYTDKYVKDNSDYSSLDAYEAAAEKILLKQAQYRVENDERQEILEKILSSSEVKKYPDKEYKLRYNYYVDMYKTTAEQNDLEFSTYLDQSLGMTEEEFNASAKSWAEDFVKRELVLNQIARLEDISISKRTYNNYIDDILENANLDKKSFKEQMGVSISDYADQNNMYTSFLSAKVMDKVMEYSIAR
ncbi:MAG: trigger factor [Clostridiales bacterium]|jgi:trigger factor|nr:trigger factor [Clostridiales bacterium]